MSKNLNRLEPGIRVVVRPRNRVGHSGGREGVVVDTHERDGERLVGVRLDHRPEKFVFAEQDLQMRPKADADSGPAQVLPAWKRGLKRIERGEREHRRISGRHAEAQGLGVLFACPYCGAVEWWVLPLAARLWCRDCDREFGVSRQDRIAFDGLYRQGSTGRGWE